LEVGGVKTNGALPRRFAAIVKVPIEGGNGFTSSVLQDDMNSIKYKMQNVVADL
jgi:hypothetical protein